MFWQGARKRFAPPAVSGTGRASCSGICARTRPVPRSCQSDACCCATGDTTRSEGHQASATQNEHEFKAMQVVSYARSTRPSELAFVDHPSAPKPPGQEVGTQRSAQQPTRLAVLFLRVLKRNFMGVPASAGWLAAGLDARRCWRSCS
jgi:hypothetical protein